MDLARLGLDPLQDLHGAIRAFDVLYDSSDSSCRENVVRFW